MNSVNPETMRGNKHCARLTPLEPAFELTMANVGNYPKQPRDVARRYIEYQALDDKTKAQVHQEMILKENEVLEQEHVAILADWWRYDPKPFGDDSFTLGNLL